MSAGGETLEWGERADGQLSWPKRAARRPEQFMLNCESTDPGMLHRR
jgi:hypothetical protein